MPQQMRLVVTITRDVVVQDDEDLDDVCEDIHEEIGLMMAGNDWAGNVELSWSPVPD